MPNFFGKDYVEAVNTDIREQIAQRKEAGEFSGQRRKADFPESQRMQNSMSTKPEILSLPLKDMKSRPVRPER